jgi:hypothetical protein
LAFTVTDVPLTFCNTAPNFGEGMGGIRGSQKAQNYLYNAIEIETLTRSIKEHIRVRFVLETSYPVG